MDCRPDESLNTQPSSTYFTGLPDLLTTSICGVRASLPEICAEPSIGVTGESGNCNRANLTGCSGGRAALLTAGPLRTTLTLKGAASCLCCRAALCRIS